MDCVCMWGFEILSNEVKVLFLAVFRIIISRESYN